MSDLQYRNGVKEIAADRGDFASKHLEKILDRFLDAENKERFEDLRGNCIKARNEMIGHADAAAFDMQHGAPVSSHRHLASALNGIDFEFFSEIIGPSHMALLDI